MNIDLTAPAILSPTDPLRRRSALPETAGRMPTIDTIHDPAEPDLVWRSHSGWSMLPSFVICGLISVAMLAIGWVFHELEFLRHATAHAATVACISALWLMQLFRWAYRAITVTYRLTPMHLFVDRGPLYPPIPAIALTDIAVIHTVANLCDRMLGTGWLSLEIAGRTSRVRLDGVLRPKSFAGQIREAMHQAQEGQIETHRVALDGVR